ncbi:MAG: SEC-C metal-binding domain-containing protein [Gemmatimonadales bacterium]|nr:SEC-C metal-binding domain-containing protein [Gemmatimonadales bacterium]
MKRANEIDFIGPLISPARQGDVLLSVLASTPEPELAEAFDDSRWTRATTLLNDAFNSYCALFWPTEGELGAQTEEWKRIREVAMPAFLDYFNTGLLADPAQVIGRIVTYVAPFDSTSSALGLITATDAIAVANWIGQELERRLAAMNEMLDRLDGVREETFRHASSLDEAREFVARHAPDLGQQLKDSIDRAGTIDRSDVIERFGPLGDQYWELFCLVRGTGSIVAYPTDDVIAATRPLLAIGPTQAMVPAINSLWTSILIKYEAALAGSHVRERFLAHRDKALENEVAIEVARIVRVPTDTIRGAFETSDGQYEHDLVVVSSGAAFIAEAKASPPTEPFRDPERAFTRIKRAFNSDKGIQKGFDQAERIRVRLASGEVVRLFGQQGGEVAELDPAAIGRQYSLVITRDNFGPIATALAPLLDKKADVPYPWVANILDLKAIADAWEFLGWGTEEFEEYLRQRAPLNGRVIASDELEIVGYFLAHGSLEALQTAEADRVHLNPHYSDFFDQLYRHRQYGGPAPKIGTTPPVMMDLAASLRMGEPVFVDPGSGRPSSDGKAAATDLTAGGKVGRNDPCPCGSGKKYKKCHGS